MTNQISNGTKKPIPLIAGLIGIAIILVLVFANRSDKSIKESASPVNPAENSIQTYKTITSNEGGVEVAVTPIDLSFNSSEWSFEVSLNTHSSELSEDLVIVSELILADGQTIKPLVWEGSSPGGHHRSGILKFSNPNFKSKSIALKIRQIGGVPERNFIWAPLESEH